MQWMHTCIHTLCEHTALHTQDTLTHCTHTYLRIHPTYCAHTTHHTVYYIYIEACCIPTHPPTHTHCVTLQLTQNCCIKRCTFGARALWESKINQQCAVLANSSYIVVLLIDSQCILHTPIGRCEAEWDFHLLRLHPHVKGKVV